MKSNTYFDIVQFDLQVSFHELWNDSGTSAV